MHVVFLILGILSLLYFICIAFFVGHGTNFFFIWLVISGGALLAAWLLKTGIWREHFPVWLRHLITAVLCAGVLLFAVTEGLILSGFSMEAPAGMDYLVVLGAQMKESGPSKALQYRLDAAFDYLMENPDTRVIVSGGQGRDEPVSEADGMYAYLVQRGIPADRILVEDQSVNTVQNLAFSASFLNPAEDQVAVVSNNFHMFRALRIAKKTGYVRVYGIAAKGEPFLQANNMMREFFGVAKDAVFGNL